MRVHSSHSPPPMQTASAPTNCRPHPTPTRTASPPAAADTLVPVRNKKIAASHFDELGVLVSVYSMAMKQMPHGTHGFDRRPLQIRRPAQVFALKRVR